MPSWFTQDKLIIILAIATVGSFIFGYWQKWLQLQIQYFVIIFGGILVFFYFVYNKSTKEVDLFDSIDKIRPTIRKELGSNPKLHWAAKHTDNKRFSKSGKVVDIEFEGNPAKAVVYLDAKSGKAVLWAPETKGREPPIAIGEATPTIPYGTLPRKIKREIKEESKA